jgi:hypothetical protein
LHRDANSHRGQAFKQCKNQRIYSGNNVIQAALPLALPLVEKEKIFGIFLALVKSSQCKLYFRGRRIGVFTVSNGLFY